MLTLALVLVLESITPAVAPPAVIPGECLVIAPLDTGAETVFGGEECDRRTLPASTFKIPHALIALDTGVVTDKTVMRWDGRKKDFPTWERDHTLDSAIKSSVVWFFQKAAESIGRERELQHLRAFAYGSQTFTREVGSFWLNGDLTISPREQVAFLRRMVAYDLPIERRHIDTVKAAMTMPPGKLSNAAGVHAFPLKWPAGTIARLKTGNGTVSGERSSWVIGALESAGREYVFASRVRSSTRTLDTTAGADLAIRILNTMAPQARTTHKNAILDLWAQGRPACGIGSLAQALGGDRRGAEAGTQKVLAEAKRARLVDMLTANPQDVAQRVKEGFLALLMQGPTADEAIRIGRAAAGR